MVVREFRECNQGAVGESERDRKREREKRVCRGAPPEIFVFFVFALNVISVYGGAIMIF